MQMTNFLERPTFLDTWLMLALAGFAFLGLVFLFSKRFLGKHQREKIMTLAVATVGILLLVECALRVTGITENYTEARMGHYNYLRHGSYQDTLHTHNPNQTHYIGDGVQFLYPRQTNSLGISDEEWQLEKPDSVYRIIALGDSFTEGDGAPADSAWPKLLEQQLLLDGMSVEVFNAGVCGSDPFHELMLLKYRLLDYQPDLVIVTIAMQDLLEDIGVKGGMERFDPDMGRVPPLFELLYAYSHIARLVYNRLLGYSWVLVRENSPSFQKEMAEIHIPRIFKEFSQVQGDFEVVFVLYPHQMQTTEGYNIELESALVESSRLNGVRMYDIRSCYLESIEESGKAVEYFWWRNDGHHNSDGYVMMSHCIRQELGL